LGLLQVVDLALRLDVRDTGRKHLDVFNRDPEFPAVRQREGSVPPGGSEPGCDSPRGKFHGRGWSFLRRARGDHRKKRDGNQRESEQPTNDADHQVPPFRWITMGTALTSETSTLNLRPTRFELRPTPAPVILPHRRA